MDFKSMNPLGIIGIIGAIIMIVGVFLNWISFIYIPDVEFTGWEIYDNGDNKHYSYAPLLCLIVGILSIVLMVLPTVVNTEKFEMINSVLGLVTLLLSIATVVIVVLFYTQDSDGVEMIDMYDFCAGYWLCLVGGIITMIGGLMPIIKNKLM